MIEARESNIYDIIKASIIARQRSDLDSVVNLYNVLREYLNSEKPLERALSSREREEIQRSLRGPGFEMILIDPDEQQYVSELESLWREASGQQGPLTATSNA